MSLYAVEVRAAEDAQLLGHINVPVPSCELPMRWAFSLRRGANDRMAKTVVLQVDRYREGSAEWLAFKVPAAQWAEIKDMLA